MSFSGELRERAGRESNDHICESINKSFFDCFFKFEFPSLSLY